MLIVKLFRKKLLIIIFFGLIGMDVFAQQDQDFNLLPLSEISSQNIFFNRKGINPSLINDTVRLDAYLVSHKEVAGYSYSPRDILFSVSGNVFNTKNLYGIEFETYKNGEFKKQTIKFSYGYKFNLNEKSNIKAAASVGFVKFSLPSDSWYILGTKVENEWGNSPCANAGITFNWLNHNIGISYLNFISSYYEYENIDYNLSHKVFTANYFSTFKISRNFNASPEIVLADHSGIADIIFKGNISYRERFTIGFFLRHSESTFGFMAKCLLFNKIELGYLLEKINHSILSGGNYAHNFKLGVIIK